MDKAEIFRWLIIWGAMGFFAVCATPKEWLDWLCVSKTRSLWYAFAMGPFAWIAIMLVQAVKMVIKHYEV